MLHLHHYADVGVVVVDCRPGNIYMYTHIHKHTKLFVALPISVFELCADGDVTDIFIVFFVGDCAANKNHYFI
jgi:hypothetical protein